MIQINQLIRLTRIMNRSRIRHHYFSQEHTVLRKALEVVRSSCALYILYGCFSVILELDSLCSRSLEKVTFCAPHKKIKSYGFGTKCENCHVWGEIFFLSITKKERNKRST